MSANVTPNPEPGTFRIQVAGTNLNFRPVALADPIPTGKQIIEAAGHAPSVEFIVLEWLANGELKEVDREETTDLRKAGAERFIVAKSDRAYRFEIDGNVQRWPDPNISRAALLAIARQDAQKFSVWQEFRETADKEIVDGTPADLQPKDTERFYTVMKHTTEGSDDDPSI